MRLQEKLQLDHSWERWPEISSSQGVIGRVAGRLRGKVVRITDKRVRMRLGGEDQPQCFACRVFIRACSRSQGVFRKNEVLLTTHPTFRTLYFGNGHQTFTRAKHRVRPPPPFFLLPKRCIELYVAFFSFSTDAAFLNVSAAGRSEWWTRSWRAWSWSRCTLGKNHLPRLSVVRQANKCVNSERKLPTYAGHFLSCRELEALENLPEKQKSAKWSSVFQFLL